MILVPAETGVTTPKLFIVATAGVAEVHAAVVFGVAEPVNVIDDPIQTFKGPVIVGNEFTVRLTEVLELTQPYED